MTDPFVGTVVGDRFQISARIGEGGMGLVYSAEDRETDGQVAVKFLHQHLLQNEEFVARFRQEAKSANSFKHDHAVGVLTSGDDDQGVPYIAMEFCPGRSLHAFLEETAPVPYDRACRIAEQVLRALGEAHRSGIIHRDLKPDNIKVETRDDGTDFVMVLDFGVAKFIGTEDMSEMSGAVKTKTGVVFGTPKYMAPEQILGDPVDGRSDIYSVGAILYEMLCGVPPFESDDVMEFVTKHLTEPVIPPRKRVPNVSIPPGLERVVMEMLDKNRVARPSRAVEVADTLLLYSKPGSGAGEIGAPGPRMQVGLLFYLLGGVIGGVAAYFLCPDYAMLGALTGVGLGAGSVLAFFLFPKVGEGAFWVRSLIVAFFLAGAGAAAWLFAAATSPLVFFFPISAFLVFVLYAAGWGRRKRLPGAILAGVVAPIMIMTLMPFPADGRFLRVWGLQTLDMSSLSAGLALTALAGIFALTALAAPRAHRGL